MVDDLVCVDVYVLFVQSGVEKGSSITDSILTTRIPVQCVNLLQEKKLTIVQSAFSGLDI